MAEHGAGGVIQQVRALAALPEGLIPAVPLPHPVMAYNSHKSSPKISDIAFGFCVYVMHTVNRHTRRQNTICIK